ncbi:MAG: geranyl transferase, partial [bacterium]
MNFPEFYADQKKRVDSVLENLLPPQPDSGLKEAMRYSTLQGGKRLRGVLVLEAERSGNSTNRPTENGKLL